jgi:hypothetical protein
MVAEVLALPVVTFKIVQLVIVVLNQTKFVVVVDAMMANHHIHNFIIYLSKN